MTRMLIAAVLLCGCATVSIPLPIGPAQSVLPPGCPVRVEKLSLVEASKDNAQVGVVCVASPWGFGPRQEDVEREVLRRACELGGDMVTVIDLCTAQRETGIEYGVFKKR